MLKEQIAIPTGRPRTETEWIQQRRFLGKLQSNGANFASSFGQTIAEDKGHGAYTMGANPCAVIAAKDRLVHLRADINLKLRTTEVVLNQFQGQKVKVFGSSSTPLLTQIEALLATRQTRIIEKQTLPNFNDSFTVMLVGGQILWFIDVDFNRLQTH